MKLTKNTIFRPLLYKTMLYTFSDSEFDGELEKKGPESRIVSLRPFSADKSVNLTKITFFCPLPYRTVPYMFSDSEFYGELKKGGPDSRISSLRSLSNRNGAGSGQIHDFSTLMAVCSDTAKSESKSEPGFVISSPEYLLDPIFGPF